LQERHPDNGIPDHERAYLFGASVFRCGRRDLVFGLAVVIIGVRGGLVWTTISSLLIGLLPLALPT